MILRARERVHHTGDDVQYSSNLALLLNDHPFEALLDISHVLYDVLIGNVLQTEQVFTAG